MTDRIHYPDFHDPALAGDPGFVPDTARIAAAADELRGEALLPGSHDLELLVIDNQKDFAAQGGALYVGGRSGEGAPRDSARLAEFIYRNLRTIGRITPTLDTHHPLQIFFPSFWRAPDGSRPAPLSTISSEDLRAGRWLPDPAAQAFAPTDVACGPARWVEAQASHYIEQLEEQGRYALTIWPYHCLTGSRGHTLEGVFDQARLFHSFARGIPSQPILKGEDAWSESYSAFKPEVTSRFDQDVSLTAAPSAADAMIRRLSRTRALVVAGQAASHCVLWSMDDLLERVEAMRSMGWATPDIYLLQDCTSSVAVPDGQGGFIADFTEDAQAALARWSKAGVHLVDSTTPVTSWPGSARDIASAL